MSVQATYDLKLTSLETPSLDDLSVGGSVTDRFDLSGILTGTSAVPVSKQWAERKALSAGAHNIDLTSLARAGLATVDMTGLKVQLFKFRNRSEASSMTVKAAASLGYAIFGASGQHVLGPGEALLIYGADQKADVAADEKVIAVTGTGTDAFDVQIVAG